MVSKAKPTGRALSMPAGLTLGAMTSLGLTLLIAAILAKLIDAEKLPWENVGYGVMLLLLVSSFLGAIVSYGKVKRQRLAVCLMSGAVYFGLLLCMTALFFGGQYEAVGVTAALVLGGSGTAGLIGLREKRGGNHRKRNPHYR
ncbi:MAG: TIGR04086 family membrane protein [Oscillospiraceae bacterium]|nr:TIGR04086 family membrane protein [Oscillospiraceae bacterium]